MLRKTPLKRTGFSKKTQTPLKTFSTLKSYSTIKSNKTIQANPDKKIGLRSHGYKKTVVDTTADLPFAKHARVRNQATIDNCRRDYCEMCGQPAGNEPHHIFPRGAGGPDIPENLIQLCPACHRKAHSGVFTKERLLKVVGRRLKIKYDKQLELIQSLRGRA